MPRKEKGSGTGESVGLPKRLFRRGKAERVKGDNDSENAQTSEDKGVNEVSDDTYESDDTNETSESTEQIIESRHGASSITDVMSSIGHDIIDCKDVTYHIQPPFQFANIIYDDESGGHVYRAVEPTLEDEASDKLIEIRKFFNVDKSIGGVTPSQYIFNKILEIVDTYDLDVDNLQLEKIFYYLKREFIGTGKIDILMKDPLIEDISCNGPGLPIYVYHRIFESIPTTIKFESTFDLNRFVLKMAQLSGNHVSVLDPITDATLPDGSRVNLTYGSEVTRKGSSFTIRKFSEVPLSPIEILNYGSVSSYILAYLWLLMEYGKSVLVSGGTATGKTSLLNAISLFIRPDDKIVSIEDTAEINIPHDNWIQSVTRSGFGRATGGSDISGISGGGHKTGDIGLYDLVIAALRQRPDYIIVGEVRGSEAFTMFQAISVGHAVMGTIHAGSMQELINRVESPPMNVPRVLLSGLDVVLFAGRILRSGSHIRRVTDVVEVLGYESGDLMTNDIFNWNAYDDRFEYTGRSYVLEKISEEFGIDVEDLNFEVEERMKLIEDMRENRVIHYKDVSKSVRSYQSSLRKKK